MLARMLARLGAAIASPFVSKEAKNKVAQQLGHDHGPVEIPHHAGKGRNHRPRTLAIKEHRVAYFWPSWRRDGFPNADKYDTAFQDKREDRKRRAMA